MNPAVFSFIALKSTAQLLLNSPYRILVWRMQRHELNRIDWERRTTETVEQLQQPFLSSCYVEH